MTQLSDAVLAATVGCAPKWVYNAAARLGLPVRRSEADAFWWRLVHTIVAGVHVPVADAASAATMLLKLSPEAGRVRLRASADDTVGLTVDLGRFHDCAAIALAAALAFALPRSRGRPRRPHPTAGDATPPHSARDLASVALPLAPEALRLFDAIAATGCAPIAIVAPEVRRTPGVAPLVRLLVDGSRSRAAILASALNALGARPRSVDVRPGFRIEGGYFGAVERMSLVVDGVDLDLAVSWPGIGSHAEAGRQAVAIERGNRIVRVLRPTAGRAGRETPP